MSAVEAISQPKPDARERILDTAYELFSRRAIRDVGVDEREHQVGGLGVEGDVADFVDDDEGDEGEAAQLGLELALALCVAEPRDPLGGGREGHLLPGQTGADRDRDR